MNTTNKILWAVGTVVVAVLVCVALLGGKSTALGTITSPATQLDYLNLTQALGFGPNAQTQGSLSTNISGVRTTLNTLNPIICSMANPFNATSTLLNATITLTTASSSASSVVFAVATSATATTTLIGSGQALPAGVLTTLQTSGVASTTDTGIPVGPGQFVNVGTVSGLNQTYAGACNGLFESAN